MILTEQDAMTKRCHESYPAALITTQGGYAVPAPALQGTPIYAVHTAPTHCLGSACMAWRWSGWRDQSGQIYANSTSRSGVEHVGYCGKAGTP